MDVGDTGGDDEIGRRFQKEGGVDERVSADGVGDPERGVAEGFDAGGEFSRAAVIEEVGEEPDTGGAELLVETHGGHIRSWCGWRQPLGVQVPEWPWRRRLRSCGHDATARHGDCWGRVRRAVHAARGSNPGLETEVVEAGDGVGGTWYWNRYPGARCDTPSMEYSYGWHEALQQEWEWSEKYATQPEILAYLDHVADRFDLRRDITFGTRVEACSFDEATERWTVRSSDGEERIARFVVMATGCLSSANLPPSRAATISVVGPSTRADGHTRESTSPVAAWR